ncbi:hypothetical protein [Archangium primigenium]|uniref:hypothetical protein n=1 Tax=[Archangium] primigenium TaxID=2792470 RepID=UPI00195B0945|nr:hypothetical protein [Archangium primigenium]MBM7112084.1 hypothetical protein [Archangium primigenium]
MRTPGSGLSRFDDLRPITSTDAASGFRCEHEALNVFFRQYATQQGRREENRTWVLPRPENAAGLPLVLGFYTLAMTQVERGTLPAPIIKRLPDYPIRAFLVGRLARDERCKRMGVGEHLLDDAHRRILRVNAEAGGLLAIVDAKDAQAAKFYADRGYAPLVRAEAEANRWPQRLYVTLATLRASYVAASR